MPLRIGRLYCMIGAVASFTVPPYIPLLGRQHEDMLVTLLSLVVFMVMLGHLWDKPTCA